MEELNSERIAYIKYRLETAKEDLESSYLLLQNGKLKSSTNRSYYSIFHSMRVILAIENIDFKHHSGVISYFRKEYIKNNIFDKSLSVIIQKASKETCPLFSYIVFKMNIVQGSQALWLSL